MKKLLSVSLIFFLAGILISCSKSDDNTFMKNMETIDIFIRNGDTSEAMKLLKKSEKKAFSSFAKIGIYRRYMTLGEEKRAENVLSKGLKKLPENPELTAVYGHFLLRHNRLSEAQNITKILEGTQYGSLRSEAIMKQLLNSDNISSDSSPFFSKEISSAYYDTYVGTGDHRWLRNCAVIYLLRGEYNFAASLQEELEDSQDALFWAFVQYDAGNYDIAAKNISKVSSTINSGNAALLASDAYMMLDDEKSAEEARNSFIINAKANGLKIQPLLFVNSSLYAFRHENYRQSYEYLIEAILSEPDYIPALLSYGKLSWKDSQPKEMSELEKALRKTTLRTNRMREYDERPKFTIADALYRMEETLERESRAGLKHNEDLIVERLSLYLKNNPDLNLKQKTAAIWNELEQNQLGTNLYPGHLVQFAVQKFLSYGLIEDGRQLFMNYINAKFDLNYMQKAAEAGTKENVQTDIFGGERVEKVPVIPESIARLAFGDRAADKTDIMEIWEIEFAAYFSLLEKNVSAAKRLYEYVVFETGGVKIENAAGEISSISPLASPSSAANLSMLYSSSGNKRKAKSLYSLAAGKSKSTQIKSKLLYRLAKLQLEEGDVDSAKTSVKYSLSLDQDNADARLLKRQLEAK